MGLDAVLDDRLEEPRVRPLRVAQRAELVHRAAHVRGRLDDHALQEVAPGAHVLREVDGLHSLDAGELRVVLARVHAENPRLQLERRVFRDEHPGHTAAGKLAAHPVRFSQGILEVRLEVGGHGGITPI